MSGPLGSEWARGWIHNVVIKGKTWTKKKIQVTLDTCPMGNTVKMSHFKILILQKFIHQFIG